MPAASRRPAAPPEPAAEGTDREGGRALRNHLEGARAISGASQKQVRVVYGTESLTVGVTGTDAGYFSARDWDVVSGRTFTEQEVRGGAGVCLLGETVRQQFFGAGDPEGSAIRVGKMSCKVIGLLEPRAHPASARTRTMWS